jgi:sarcosine oxidase
LAASWDVVVVGLGAMGGSALRHLARRGARVLGLERATPGHPGGSSHGESRVIRLAYFEHPSYVPLLRAAYAGWRELEAESGEQVMRITGILEAGVPGAEVVEGSLAAARQHGLEHEVLNGAEINRRFPAYALPPDWRGVFQPDGGILEPERAIALQLASAGQAGAEVRIGCGVRAVEPDGTGVRIVLEDGAQIAAGAAILAAGAWMSELEPELAQHLRLTRQPLIWFDPAAPRHCTPERFPVFLLETPDDVIYGFPDFMGTGVKAGSHAEGRTLARAADARQDADEADARRVREALERWAPAAAGRVLRQTTCIYTRTPDSDFIVDLSPRAPQIVLASPCSGHGFKFASVMGEVLADLALAGSTRHDISRFRLGRFS